MPPVMVLCVLRRRAPRARGGPLGGRYGVRVSERPGAADARPSPHPAPPGQRSWARLAAGLVLLEAVPALAAAVAFLVELVTSSATVARNVAMLAVVLAVLGAGLVVVGRGLLAGRRWARSPALTWQVLLLAVAWYVVSAGRAVAGVLVAAVAVLTAVAAVRATPARD